MHQCANDAKLDAKGMTMKLAIEKMFYRPC